MTTDIKHSALKSNFSLWDQVIGVMVCKVIIAMNSGRNESKSNRICYKKLKNLIFW